VPGNRAVGNEIGRILEKREGRVNDPSRLNAGDQEIVVARWIIVAHESFPIWNVVSKLVDRERLEGGRVKWLVDAPDYIQVIPRTPKGIISVEAAEATAETVSDQKAA